MQTNSKATVALGAGIAVVVLQIVAFCMGMIPFVNFLVLLVLPVIFIADITAIVAGVLGLKEAGPLGGVGKGPAIVGIVIGAGHLLLVVAGLGIGLLVGGLSLVMGALGG